MIFSIDIIRNNSDERLIIKNIKSLNKMFDNFNIKFNVYASFENIINNKNKIFIKNSNSQHSIDLFINIEDKLVNFDFDKYSIKSFKVLDDLKDAKLLDYSLDISWNIEIFQ